MPRESRFAREKRLASEAARRRTPSAEDAAQAEIHKAACKAAVDAMRPMLEENPNKLMKHLYPHELDAIVAATIGAYVVKRDEMERRAALAAELNDPINDLWPSAGLS